MTSHQSRCNSHVHRGQGIQNRKSRHNQKQRKKIQNQLYLPHHTDDLGQGHHELSQRTYLQRGHQRKGSQNIQNQLSQIHHKGNLDLVQRHRKGNP
eukprot:11221938-Ditylum_brightwellii.AAC.1